MAERKPAPSRDMQECYGCDASGEDESGEVCYVCNGRGWIYPDPEVNGE